MRRLCVIFGKWQGAEYWSKGVCVLVGVRRVGVVENEAEGWGDPGKRLRRGRPYMPLVLSVRPAFAKIHAMED